MNTSAPATTTPVDPEAALAAFRAQYVVPGSHVLDAWLDRGFIKYHVDPDRFADNLGKIPHEYMGVDTVITLFPNDE